MSRILLTGGAGYVGSHCAKALAAAGHEGIVFDSLLFGHCDLVRWGKLIKGDIRDADAQCGVCSVSDRRGDAFRGSRLCRGIGPSAGPLLRCKCEWHPDTARRNGTRWRSFDRVFVKLRDIWRAGPNANRGEHAVEPDQSVRVY